MLRLSAHYDASAHDRRITQRLADDAEAGTIAAYAVSRRLVRVITEAAARDRALARLETALRCSR